MNLSVFDVCIKLPFNSYVHSSHFLFIVENIESCSIFVYYCYKSEKQYFFKLNNL